MDFVEISPEGKAILEQARATYGEYTQILVSTEELCELACVCAKFPRFEDSDTARKELYDKAVDEMADVLIILDHIEHIFRLSPKDVQDRVNSKIDRLHRWLSKSTSQYQTMIDRKVDQVNKQEV